MTETLLNLADEEVRAKIIHEFRLQHTQATERETHVSSDIDEDNQTNSIPKHEEATSVLGYTLLPGERVLERNKRSSSGNASYSVINDIPALQRKLEEIEYKPPKGLSHIPWIEKLSITAQRVAVEETVQKDTGQDIARESQFHELASQEVTECLRRLKVLGMPFNRPMDFLAEMLKSDTQMQKVRTKIADEQERIASVDARKQKQLNKKFKKESAPEMNNRVKRQKELQLKNQTLKEIEEWKRERAQNQHGGSTAAAAKTPKKDKSSGTSLHASAYGMNSKYYNPTLHTESAEQSLDYFLEQQEKRRNKASILKKNKSNKTEKPISYHKVFKASINKKRENHNKKFGFGGTKRFAKRNDAKSTETYNFKRSAPKRSNGRGFQGRKKSQIKLKGRK